MKLFNERLVKKSQKGTLVDILTNKRFDEEALRFIDTANLLELYFEIDESELK